MEENGGGCKLGYYSSIFLEWLRKNYQKSSGLTGDLDGDANPRPRKFEYRHATIPPGTSHMPVLTASAVPLSPLHQMIFPTAMSLRRVTSAVGGGLLSIFVSQTVLLPRCHHGLIRDTVSAMHASLSRILSSRDKNRHEYSQMIMTFVQLGVGGEGSQDATWPDPTLGINLISVPWPFLSYEAVRQSY
jgi:hypothetical protein